MSSDRVVLHALDPAYVRAAVAGHPLSGPATMCGAEGFVVADVTGLGATHGVSCEDCLAVLSAEEVLTDAS